MHSRHRSPGNGYNRPSSTGMGMGMAAPSRISPSADNSLRGQSLYATSGYRGFNRGGFGRTKNIHPKSFQPPPTSTPPIPPKPDIFVEAGRLAAEYLFSQGLLPPTPKWQNANTRFNSVGYKSEFRPQDIDNLKNPQEGRTSAISCLRNAVSDASSGKRRFSGDEFGHSGFRVHLKGRRRSGSSYRGYGSDSGRDYGSRSSSFSDRTNINSRVSSENDNKGEDDDSVSGQREEQVPSKDVGNGVQKSKTEDADKAETDMDVVMGLKSTSSVSENDPLQEIEDKEAVKSSDDLTNLNAGTEDVMDKDCPSSVLVDETEKPSAIEELSNSVKAAEDDSFGNNTTDLVCLCKFSKLPTRTRSSLTSKLSNVDPPRITQFEEASGFAPQGELELRDGNDSRGNSSSYMLMDKTDDSKLVESEIPKAQSVQSADCVSDLEPTCIIEQVDTAKLSPFSGTTFPCDSARESSRGPLKFGSFSAMVDDRGDKRALKLDDVDQQDGAKKPRELLSPMVMEEDESFHLSTLSEMKVYPQEDVFSSCEKPVVASVHDSKVVNDSELSKVEGQHAREKQHFPSSFKICDLNLMEVSEMHENHDREPNMSCPSLPEEKRESAPIDIDLSISKSILPGKNSRSTGDGKTIEVIDLETDCAEEDKDLTMVEPKTETVCNGLEGFPNHAQNTGDISNVQDGYGLMISELLGNDFSSCSSVPGDINSIHNDIGPHNEEATLGDDDSIYMSLGEIPLSTTAFLRSWEQPPTQEFEKPF